MAEKIKDKKIVVTGMFDISRREINQKIIKQGYAAIDNRCGDAWTEWFGSLGSALNWIYKYN